MISINDKHNCCGCEACVQICPKHCISFKQDAEGFFYPKVDVESCIDCGLCEKVCPILNSRQRVLPISVCAAQSKDENIRKTSSSGGLCTLLAEQIIDEGGVVFGVSFNEKWEATHSYAENKDQLIAFRGSKYVQSRINDCFLKIKEFLIVGRKVLFIGTPCQVSALKFFLRKEYTNLITIDFICHGVPSPGIFKWYLQEEIDKYVSNTTICKSMSLHSLSFDDIELPPNLKIRNIIFRDKSVGWQKYSFVLELTDKSVEKLDSNITISSTVLENSFLRGFGLDLYLRPSCHRCSARNFRSGSDITLGDFWGQAVLFPDFDNDTGVSSVIVKTESGIKLLSSIKNIKIETKSIDDVIRFNPSLISSKKETYRRFKFWRMVGKYSFQETIKRTIDLSFFEKIISKVFQFFYK